MGLAQSLLRSLGFSPHAHAPPQAKEAKSAESKPIWEATLTYGGKTI